MFINTSKGYLNTDHIVSYFNIYRKEADGEIKAAECRITLVGETGLIIDRHLDLHDNNDNPNIIAALPGYNLLCHYKDDDDKVEYWEEPIIAWKIEGDWVTPISVATSWEDFMTKDYYFMKEGDPRVFSPDQTYDSLEKYKEDRERRTK